MRALLGLFCVLSLGLTTSLAFGGPGDNHPDDACLSGAWGGTEGLAVAAERKAFWANPIPTLRSAKARTPAELKKLREVLIGSAIRYVTPHDYKVASLGTEGVLVRIESAKGYDVVFVFMLPSGQEWRIDYDSLVAGKLKLLEIGESHRTEAQSALLLQLQKAAENKTYLAIRTHKMELDKGATSQFEGWVSHLVLGLTGEYFVGLNAKGPRANEYIRPTWIPLSHFDTESLQLNPNRNRMVEVSDAARNESWLQGRPGRLEMEGNLTLNFGERVTNIRVTEELEEALMAFGRRQEVTGSEMPRVLVNLVQPGTALGITMKGKSGQIAYLSIWHRADARWQIQSVTNFNIWNILNYGHNRFLLGDETLASVSPAALLRDQMRQILDDLSSASARP